MRYAQNARDIVIVNDGIASGHGEMEIALANYSTDRSHIVTNIIDVGARLSRHQEAKAASNSQNVQETEKSSATNGKHKCR